MGQYKSSRVSGTPHTRPTVCGETWLSQALHVGRARFESDLPAKLKKTHTSSCQTRELHCNFTGRLHYFGISFWTYFVFSLGGRRLVDSLARRCQLYSCSELQNAESIIGSTSCAASTSLDGCSWGRLGRSLETCSTRVMHSLLFCEADVAVPSIADVPADEVAFLYVSPLPSAAVTRAIVHGGWTTLRGLREAGKQRSKKSREAGKAGKPRKAEKAGMQDRLQTKYPKVGPKRIPPFI